MRQLFSLILALILCLPAYGGAREIEDCDWNLIRHDQDTAQLESLAVEIMRQVTEHQANSTDTVLGWMRSIQESEHDHPLSVMEHVALVYILRSGIFADYPDAKVLESLRQSIRTSYQYLTQKQLADGEELTPLPGGILRKGSLAALVFHDTIMQPSLQSQVRQTVGPFSFVNVASVLLTGIAMAFEPGRVFLASALIGLTQASITEYMIHIGLGHASKAVTKSLRHFGKIGEFMEEVSLDHKLHHTVVSAYFGAANLPPEQKEVAERTLRKLAESLVLDRMKDQYPETPDKEIRAMSEFSEKVERVVDSTRKGNYGVNGSLRGSMAMLTAATPFYVMNYIIYKLTGSENFLLTGDIWLTTMILQSMYSHWYLHLVPKDESLPGLSALQIYYVKKTWFGQLSRRLHFTHHDLPFSSDRTKNGVIMAGSVYDRLKGDLQMPRLNDLIKFFQDGYLSGD